MHLPSGPVFDVRTFVLLMFAGAVSAVASVLSYYESANLFQALLVGGGAAAAALAWGNSTLEPPSSQS